METSIVKYSKLTEHLEFRIDAECYPAKRAVFAGFIGQDNWWLHLQIGHCTGS